MAARMPKWMDMREGSYASDNLRAVAAELERINAMGIEYMPHRFFPMLAEGEDLTLAAANFGIERKAAAKAQTVLTVYGAAGTAFTDVKAAAGDIVFDVADGVIGEDGSTNVLAVAQTAGKAGNAAAGAINETVAEYEGIAEVINREAAYGGTDEETDEALRERVRERWVSPSTGGNKADYISWALAVEGVSDVRVLNPEGGKVHVYIVAEGNLPADEALVEKTALAIEEKRPIGAAVTVFAAQPVYVNVGVNFGVSEGTSKEAVLEVMRERMQEYIAGICFKSDAVSYLKTAGVLFADGVSDIEDYTLNGTRESIAIGETEFACLNEVSEL